MDVMIAWRAATLFLTDYFAVAVGVLSGVLFAIDRDLDIVGCVSLGLVVGYGGGIIRDILLHDQGFFFMDHPNLVVFCIVLAAMVFLLREHLKIKESHLFTVDALSMALYAVAGASKVYLAGASAVFVIILGALTAVGGGVLRDVCLGETPAVFRPSNFYAVSGIIGSTVYVIFASFGIPLSVAGVTCVVVAFLLTVLSPHFGWRTFARRRR